MSSTEQQTSPSTQAGEPTQSPPSQVQGQLKAAQGVVYNAIASVIPESAGSSAWAADGQRLTEEARVEVEEAKAAQASQATWDAAGAKLKSATGYLTGDQQKQSEGNLENEKAQWAYKQATTEGMGVGVPVPSVEGVKGKVESVVGMVTGDQAKQVEGNMKAEKAAWKDGV